MGETAVKNRMIHFDLLRILACFSVVVLHCGGVFWYDWPVDSNVWLAANSYDALFRFGVPIFVMISGALFLAPDKTLDWKRLYRHNILKLLILFALWSSVYGLLDIYKMSAFGKLSTKQMILELLYGRYHLWFLPMLVGIYMLLPVLKIWIGHADKRNLQYFLLLFLVMQILRSTVSALFPARGEVAYLMSIVNVDLACGYVGYFVLGYYIAHIGIEPGKRKWIYVGGVFGEIMDLVLSNLLSRKMGEPCPDIYDSYSLFTFLAATALFVFFTDRVAKHPFRERTGRIIREVSASTLGIYVMHVGALELAQPLLFRILPDRMIIGMPLLAFVCFGVCLAVTLVLRKIPVLGKYLV